MSAVLKPDRAASFSRTPPVAPMTGRQLRVVPPGHKAAAAHPIDLPIRRCYPLWLRLMMLGQWLSCGVAGITVAGALLAYALTVHTDRRLNLTADTLAGLQDQQQQLVSANAVFQKHLAQTAVTALEGNTLHPKEVIFLETAEPSKEASSREAAPRQSVFSDEFVFPKGY